MIFRKKKASINSTLLYESFLYNVDAITETRLRGFDISFNNFKEKLALEGFFLSEIDCLSEGIVIKRNKNGFYLWNGETEILSKKGADILIKYKLDFERIHKFLCEKESIMAGNYTSSKRNLEVLMQISEYLGYGKKRTKILEEC